MVDWTEQLKSQYDEVPDDPQSVPFVLRGFNKDGESFDIDCMYQPLEQQVCGAHSMHLLTQAALTLGVSDGIGPMKLNRAIGGP